MSPEIVAIAGLLGEKKPLRPHIILGDDIWLWVDAGTRTTPDDWIMPELCDRGLVPPPRNLAVITHADVDHLGGLARLQELVPSLVVMAHSADMPLLASPEELMTRRYDAFQDGGVVLSQRRRAQLRDRAGTAVTPEVQLETEVTVDIGSGGRWRILHVPGHSAGHLAVWNPETRVLVAGDAVMGWGVVDGDGDLQPPHYVDVNEYLSTIRRLQAMDVRELRLSHEPVLRGRQVTRFLAESAAAVELIGKAVVAAADAGVPESPSRLLGTCEFVKDATDRWGRAGAPAFAATVVAHLDRLGI